MTTLYLLMYIASAACFAIAAFAPKLVGTRVNLVALGLLLLMLVFVIQTVQGL